ncbi:efflux RND transporter periplasmic adaptor subunit [Ectobacillus antri]|uniref:Efflux RND transporter periplasmic adaptor subunit n=1 Tax=Ectobacillus antri TaxID=2486280 RepID=A0ABT6H8A1_9BACI|nr:efflux RND transporter periplasmic adaptor subunit [Ectobacillus antri]MDG4658561.1 efflux RND transporter periplasmic adaptor subunit [Ectobacillus antri]MDG5755565.1 efflux RND transporter periplasmic adaptor subunit [Ectobacillus antri]
MQAELVQKPKRKKWIVAGVVAAVVLVAGINIAVVKGKKNPTEALQFEKVTERTIQSTKLISGQVVPGSIENVYVDVAKGKVSEIFVNEGDAVTKGQKLFSYESSELSLQVKQIELEKKMTAMRYEQGKDKIASVKKDIQKATDAAMREPLNAQLAELEFQQKTIELEIEKNKLQAQELANRQNELIVYSSIDGVIQKLDKDATQTQGMGQPKALMQIASKDPYQIQGTLTELQKGQIVKDQKVTISAKAVSNKKWIGKIIEVSEYPTSADSGQLAGGGQPAQMVSYYPYKAVLDSQEGLSPGYHVSLQVELEAKTMLAVPRTSVKEDAEEPYVFLVEGNKLKKQTVTTGMSDGEWIEILEGVTAGQSVVKNPAKNVNEGMEVKNND